VRRVEPNHRRWWTADDCGKHCGDISASTWRSYALEGRTPAARPHRDRLTGKKVWDSRAVIAWHAARAGQGARTDLATGYLDTPNGHRVFINQATITTAGLLMQARLPSIHRDALMECAGVTRQQLTSAITALVKVGAVTRDGHHIVITDLAVLARVADLAKRKGKEGDAPCDADAHYAQPPTRM
jgi:hypothetical protein